MIRVSFFSGFSTSRKTGNLLKISRDIPGIPHIAWWAPLYVRPPPPRLGVAGVLVLALHGAIAVRFDERLLQTLKI